MSSIILTPRIRNHWKTNTLRLLNQLRTNQSDSNAVRTPDDDDDLDTSSTPGPLAPRPSSVPPINEEFGEAMRSMAPYRRLGLNNLPYSAIITMVGIETGTTDAQQYPFHYFAGCDEAPDRTSLSLARGLTGIPLVMEEPFPYSFLTEAAPGQFATRGFVPFPARFMNRVVLTTYDQLCLIPSLWNRATEEMPTTPHAIPDQVRRAIQSGTYTRPTVPWLDSFYTSFRYAGCLRLATDAEVNRMFDEVLIESAQVANNDISFRDFFQFLGVDRHEAAAMISESDTLLERASAERQNERVRATQAAAAVPSTPTDVAPPAPEAAPRPLFSTRAGGRTIRLDQPPVATANRAARRAAQATAAVPMPAPERAPEPPEERAPIVPLTDYQRDSQHNEVRRINEIIRGGSQDYQIHWAPHPTSSQYDATMSSAFLGAAPTTPAPAPAPAPHPDITDEEFHDDGN